MAKLNPKKRTASSRSSTTVVRRSGPNKARKPRRAIDKVYASLLANMPGEVYRCRNDRDWTMEYVSEGVLALTGYLPDDFLSGRVKFGDLVHPEDAENARQACQEALARREPYTLEYRIRAKDGAGKWVWERGAGVFDRSGRVVALEGFVGDVTERKRSEVALRVQTEQLMLGQSTAGTVVMDWDIAHDRLSWSASPEWLRGPLPPGGEYPLYKDQVHPEDRAEFLRRRQIGVEKPGRISDEYRIVRTDGKVLWILSQRVSLTGPDGRVNRMLVAIHDITKRKEAERALEQSEARFRDFAQASGDWFWETDADNRYAWFSGNLEPGVGRPPSFYLGRDRLEVAVAAGANLEAEPWKSHVSAIGQREPFRNFVHRRVTPTGEYWLSVSGTPRFDADGGFLGYRAAVANITARMRVEQRIREVEQRLGAALDGLNEAIAVTDADDRIVVTNRYFQALNGDTHLVDPGRLYAEHLRAGIDIGNFPEAIGREEEWLAARLIARRRGGTFEVQRQDKWLRVTDQPLPDGGVITFAPDITARKNVEEALRASERRFRALVELSSDWYWQTDAQHRFTNCVGDVLDSMGLAPAADLGKRWDEVGFLNLREADWAAHFAMLERREEFRDLLLERPGPERRTFWATISGRPLYDDAGVFVGYHGIGRDITAQVEAEHALHDLNVELEVRVAQRTAALKAAYQELESFSYSVSHDLRAPLRAISGFAGILREDEGGRLSDAGLRHLSTIDASAQQMGKLVDALLELVRMSRHAIVGSRIDMAQVAREVVETLSLEHPRARIEVREMPDANGDATLVRQVYANLIGNALKYSAPEAAPEVIVDAYSNAGATVYFVRDNGVGFDMRYAGKLFKPFERLHTDPGFKGTGIGLALASLIVRRHGGRIEADSAPGEGATFRFTLGGA